MEETAENCADDVVEVIYDMFAFPRRFSQSYHIQAEMNELIEMLNHKMTRLYREMDDKIYIKQCLNSNFIKIGNLLPRILGTICKLECSNVNKTFLEHSRKTFDRLWVRYCQDKKQHDCFEKIREFTISIQPIPNSWKCWSLKTRSGRCAANRSQQKEETSIANHLAAIQCNIKTINKDIERLQFRLSVLDEIIVWLFLHCKKSMQCLIKFSNSLGQCEEAFHDDRLAIQDLFEIENKISFTSSPLESYCYKSNSICMKIIVSS